MAAVARITASKSIDGFSNNACHGLAAVCTSAAMCLTGPRATVQRRSASAIDALAEARASGGGMLPACQTLTGASRGKPVTLVPVS